MTWDGVERRKMDRDWLDRDRMLSEIHTDMKHMLDWAKSHDTSDNDRFRTLGDRVSWIEKMAYGGIGGLALLNIILKMF